MSVYAEALLVDDALACLKRFEREGLRPDVKTYHALVRMYVRNRDIASALAVKREMLEERNIRPDKLTYGLLIESLSHRDMIVEALKELEQSTDFGIKVSERHIRLLRRRCEKLGIVHPNMPSDPYAWAKEVKKIRREKKDSTQRYIEPLRSKMYS